MKYGHVVSDQTIHCGLHEFGLLQKMVQKGHTSDLGRCSFKGAQEWTNRHRLPQEPKALEIQVTLQRWLENFLKLCHILGRHWTLFSNHG